MTTTKEHRKELKEKFLKLHLDDFNNEQQALLIFDFFYSEIESLQSSENELCLKVQKEQDEAVRIYNQGEERDKMRLNKITHLEELLKAADEVIELCRTGHFSREAFQAYNKLKTKTHIVTHERH